MSMCECRHTETCTRLLPSLPQYKRNYYLAVVCAIPFVGIEIILYFNTTTTPYTLRKQQHHPVRLIRPGNDIWNTAVNNVAKNSLDLYPYYLKIRNVTNLKQTANGFFSVLNIPSNRTTFYLGEVISVRIELYNGYGERLSSGGDLLRIWMTDTSNNANVNGHVIDIGNGSYIGHVMAVWKGKALIKISIANTKEQIGLVIQYLERYGLLRNIKATFKSENKTVSETTLCSVKPLYRQMCNFTEENHGLHWYCRRPRNRLLTCQNWRTTTGTDTNSLSPIALKLTRSHKNLMMREQPVITVKGDNQIVKSDKTPCHKRPKRDTWLEPSPAGFYFKGQWRTLRCSNKLDNPAAMSYVNCLRGFHVLLIGDSNLRSWFVRIKDMLNMTITTKTLNIKWYTALEAENLELNASMSLAVHANPFYGGSTALPKTSIQSVAWQLDQINTTRSVAVVIHMYLHLARTVPEEYRAHVKEAKTGIDRLFKRTPNAVVFIKGPHAVTTGAFQVPVDYIRNVQEQILYEEFRDMIDQVVFLNQWDMTSGCENIPIHPHTEYLNGMVDLFISYLCY